VRRGYSGSDVYFSSHLTTSLSLIRFDSTPISFTTYTHIPTITHLLRTPLRKRQRIQPPEIEVKKTAPAPRAAGLQTLNLPTPSEAQQTSNSLLESPPLWQQCRKSTTLQQARHQPTAPTPHLESTRRRPHTRSRRPRTQTTTAARRTKGTATRNRSRNRNSTTTTATRRRTPGTTLPARRWGTRSSRRWATGSRTAGRAGRAGTDRRVGIITGDMRLDMGLRASIWMIGGAGAAGLWRR